MKLYVTCFAFCLQRGSFAEASRKLRGSFVCESRSEGLNHRVAVFELELRKRASRTTLVLPSCNFRAGAAEVYFTYYTCATKLRIFELKLRKCTSRTTLVLRVKNHHVQPLRLRKRQRVWSRKHCGSLKAKLARRHLEQPSARCFTPFLVGRFGSPY